MHASDAKRRVPWQRTRHPPKVGLVLGSGGARGWAHVGICRTLFAQGLKPHCIVGTSIGAVVGALAAAGKLDTLIEMAHFFDWQQTARMFVEAGLPRSGLINGRRIQRLLREIIGSGRIESLPISFAAVATDLEAETEVVLDRGDIVSALRASLSIPGLFAPARQQGRWLIDGGLVNPLPVDVARAMGADVVIASEVNLRRGKPVAQGEKAKAPVEDDLSAVPDAIRRLVQFVRRRSEALAGQSAEMAEDSGSWGRGPPSLFEVLLRATRIGENRITLAQLERHAPEVLLQPPVGHFGTLAFHHGREIMDLGRTTTRAWINNESVDRLPWSFK